MLPVRTVPTTVVVASRVLAAAALLLVADMVAYAYAVTTMRSTVERVAPGVGAGSDAIDREVRALSFAFVLQIGTLILFCGVLTMAAVFCRLGRRSGQVLGILTAAPLLSCAVLPYLGSSGSALDQAVGNAQPDWANTLDLASRAVSPAGVDRDRIAADEVGSAVVLRAAAGAARIHVGAGAVGRCRLDAAAAGRAQQRNPARRALTGPAGRSPNRYGVRRSDSRSEGTPHVLRRTAGRHPRAQATAQHRDHRRNAALRSGRTDLDLRDHQRCHLQQAHQCRKDAYAGVPNGDTITIAAKSAASSASSSTSSSSSCWFSWPSSTCVAATACASPPG